MSNPHNNDSVAVINAMANNQFYDFVFTVNPSTKDICYIYISTDHYDNNAFPTSVHNMIDFFSWSCEVANGRHTVVDCANFTVEYNYTDSICDFERLYKNLDVILFNGLDVWFYNKESDVEKAFTEYAVVSVQAEIDADTYTGTVEDFEGWDTGKWLEYEDESDEDESDIEDLYWDYVFDSWHEEQYS